MTIDHDALVARLTRLQLTAIRDGLDTLLDEAARRELTLRETLAFLVEREVAARTSGVSRWRSRSPTSRPCANLTASTSPPSPRSGIVTSTAFYWLLTCFRAGVGFSKSNGLANSGKAT